MMKLDKGMKIIFTTSNRMDNVCKVDDDFVRDKMRWVVTLNNKEIIYEDDDRPGQIESSSWKRLKAYCENNQLYIIEMWLQFRSNRVLIEPKNADGYYLIKSAFGVWGDTDTFHAYIAGAIVDGQILTHHWKVPELVVLEKEIREVDKSSPSLIFRQKLTNP